MDSQLKFERKILALVSLDSHWAVPNVERRCTQNCLLEQGQHDAQPVSV